MSFLSRAFTGPEQEPAEVRGINPANWGIPKPSEDIYFHQGHIPEGNPMSLGAFYACVTLLADTIASLTVRAYRRQEGIRVPVEPQPTLLADSPYPEVTWFDWLWMLMEALAVTGNGYGLITGRDRLGKATAVMPIHPDCVHIEIPENRDWPDPVYYIEGKRVSTANIVHIKRYPIAGCVKGMSPVQKAASAIGLGLAAERYGLRYFRDSANPSGILSSDVNVTPEQAKQAQKMWIQSHQGRRLPAVMSNGLKWQAVTLTPNESQFLETRQFQVSEIARWFRIPPHMIGDTEKSTSWGTGIEEQTIGFVTYTLRPWLTCIEQAITKLLPRGQFAKFNIDGLLRGDVRTRWEAYKMGREAGVYSVNEIREKEDLPPVPDGEGRLQPMNFVPLGTDPADLQSNETQSNQPAENGEE